MKWIKKGLIFTPDKNIWWQQNYAMMPTPFLLNDDVIRIYFGTTDSDNFGRPCYIDVNAHNPGEIISKPKDFLMDLGAIGTFDDSGVIPSSVVNINNQIFVYYVGFQRAARVPYMLYSGLMLSDESHNFSRYSKAPIIDRNSNNIYSNAAPFVIYDESEKLYKMWFWLGKEWVSVKNKLYINAEIHYTTSYDGINWDKNSTICIKPNSENKEFSLGRPWVIKKGNGYKMYYSVRYVDKLYRLGFAESKDGINWIRKDEQIGIDVSKEGWDSEMICYPAELNVKEQTYLFYNGNNNGETGFGYAILEK